MSTVILADYDGRAWDGLARILAEMERRGANPSTAPRPQLTTPKGRTVEQMAVTFDGNAVRDAHVHGWACNAGYVAHIEH